METETYLMLSVRLNYLNAAGGGVGVGPRNRTEQDDHVAAVAIGGMLIGPCSL